MARAINQTILMGRLTRDPELRSTGSGKSVVSFSIAVDRQSGDETDFFEITAWEKLADLIDQYLSKGSKVLVQGRLQQDSWDDKDTGKKRSKISITANDVTFLDTKNDNSKQDVSPKDIDDKPVDLSEIPF